MSIEDQSPTLDRIEISGDVLVTDQEFCEVVLNGATRRTARRYELQGLPTVMVRGRKFRPLNQGREWLASRITARKPALTRRRSR